MPSTPPLPSAAQLDALLPQTQCMRCGFNGCLPYAEALAQGAAAANRCPPGGQGLADQLATLLGQPQRPLDAECGREGPWTLAFIDAERCIGCARCLPPCPVDAIVGAQRLLHTVIDGWCTGCELCVSACPVDCIEMRPRTATAPAQPAANLSRARYQAHQRRASEHQTQRARLLEERKRAARGEPS
ncbi:MAG: RnfABCDGE type electron transport complex subunit B [Steroidobacteraceae bacterium]